MKAVFLIHRTVFYKFMAPLIQEALFRGYDVECWHNYGHKIVGSKAYSFPNVEDAPLFKKSEKLKFDKFEGSHCLENKLRQLDDIDFVFSIHFFNSDLGHMSLDDFKFRWVTIMSGIDNFFELSTFKIGKKRLNKELFFVHSKEVLEEGRRFLRTFFPEAEECLSEDYVQVETVGTVEFDSLQNMDLSEIRAQYGIPDDKDICVYLPFPYANRSKSSWERAFSGMNINTFRNQKGVLVHSKKNNVFKDLIYKAWCLGKIFSQSIPRKYFLAGLTEENMFMAIRKFCDKNNLFLVVKPRLKFPVAESVKANADLIIWDDEKKQNPSLLKELLSISKVSIGCCSTAVLTSAFQNVYSINVELPDEFFIGEFSKFWFSSEYSSRFHYPGIVENWKIEDMVKSFGSKNLDEFSVLPQKRAEYIKMFNEYDDYGASIRILDKLELEIEKDNGKNNLANRS